MECGNIEEIIKYYECQMCHAILEIKAEIDKYVYDEFLPIEDQIESPIECLEYQGGCGRKTKFREVKKEWVEKYKKELELKCLKR